jgi:hypothetical protein
LAQRKIWIYAAVVGILVVSAAAVFLFLDGYGGSALGASAVAVALAAAASRGEALQETKAAQAAVTGALAADDQKAIDALEAAIESVRTRMRSAGDDVSVLTPEEKLAALHDLQKGDDDGVS